MSGPVQSIHGNGRQSPTMPLPETFVGGTPRGPPINNHGILYWIWLNIIIILNMIKYY